VGSELRQQAKESETHEQSVGGRPGTEAERNTKGISMRRWQLLQGLQARNAKLLGRGKRKFFLGFIPDRPEYVKPLSRLHRVVQQCRLANAGFAKYDDRAPVSGAGGVQNSIEHLALALSPEQGGRGIL
jgi:hypothetical protein